jgi:hypothetical protein
MGGDVLLWVMVGIFVLLLVFVLLLGLFYPGSGAEQLKWKPTRSPELEVQNEIDDLEQMLAATNAKRRRRGEAELTEEGVHARLREDEAERERLHDRATAAEEERQMREARDALRRRREERERKQEP